MSKSTGWKREESMTRESRVKQTPGRDHQTGNNKLTCKYCFRIHTMKKEVYPAWGRICNSCRQRNHFQNSQMCKYRTKNNERNVHTVDDEEELSDTWTVDRINSVTMSDIHAVQTNSRPLCYGDKWKKSDTTNRQWSNCKLITSWISGRSPDSKQICLAGAVRWRKKAGCR